MTYKFGPFLDKWISVNLTKNKETTGKQATKFDIRKLFADRVVLEGE